MGQERRVDHQKKKKEAKKERGRRRERQAIVTRYTCKRVGERERGCSVCAWEDVDRSTEGDKGSQKEAERR